MKISIGQAKILYAIVNGQSVFQPSDFGTNLEIFQLVATAIMDLSKKGMTRMGKLHQDLRQVIDTSI